MEIIRMIVDELDCPENLVFGPAIEIFSYGEEQMDETKMPMSFYIEPERFEDVRDEVHEHVIAFMASTGETDYKKAMDAVLEERPELKERYARS